MISQQQKEEQYGEEPHSRCDRGTGLQQLSDKILYEAGVFITPGFIFGRNGENYVRISLCARPEVLQEARRRIGLSF